MLEYYVPENYISRLTREYPGIPIHFVFCSYIMSFLAGSMNSYLLGAVALTVILQALNLGGTNLITKLLNQIVETND